MDLSPQQKVILSRMLLSEAAYLLAMILMTVTILWDLSVLTPGHILFFAVTHYLAVAVFAGLVVTGRSQRFSEPSMVFYQILVLFVTHIPLLYYMGHDIRGAALLCFIMPLPFAALKLNYRQTFHLSIYPILMYILVAFVTSQYRPGQFQRDVEISRTIVFAIVTMWISFFSAYVSRLRLALKAKRRELAVTNDTLVRIQQDLVDTAHRAGMAEVTAEVLHNVGNSLNSMSVSTELVRDTIRSQKLELIRRLAQMLNEHQHDLPGFFKNDDRAQHIPEAFQKLSHVLEKTQTESLDELAQLRASIESLRTTLNTHQSNIKPVRYRQGVLINSLIAEVLSVLDVELEAEHITVQLKLAPVPELFVEKSKLSQVLIHMIQNAREAMAALPLTQTRTLTIQNYCNNHTLIMEITDTGAGITAANTADLFNQGFTTKGGSGGGLHYCANTMAAMGGSIRAANHPIHSGAVFTLELPVTPHPASNPNPTDK